jgi:hypothetical protein
MSAKSRASPKCGACGEVGHGSTSNDCPIKKQKKDQEVVDFLALYDLETTPAVDLAAIAATTGITEGRYKEIYKLHISPLRVVRRNIKYEAPMVPMASCSRCSKAIHRDPCEWRGSILCFGCHDETYDERERLWAQLKEHDVSSGRNHCICCNRERPTHGRGFHYDHIHFLEKADAICTMIHRGDTLEEIIAEGNRCQLLCKDCHAHKTKREENLGFTRFKKNDTRAKNKAEKEGEEYELDEATKLEIYAEYEKVFGSLTPAAAAPPSIPETSPTAP